MNTAPPSGLMFTCRALQTAQEDHNLELYMCFKRAYDIVLRHHHSFIIRSVVSVSGIMYYTASSLIHLSHIKLTFQLSGCYPCRTSSRRLFHAHRRRRFCRKVKHGDGQVACIPRLPRHQTFCFSERWKLRLCLVSM